jgi:hypothetical protein
MDGSRPTTGTSHIRIRSHRIRSRSRHGIRIPGRIRARNHGRNHGRRNHGRIRIRRP